ncbi:hypothetical protein MP638_002354 [Amoeboaphelidium occidentale]|nr:hypothetical protein MP638_002354 [Amoeboaphelidium occidentale]
MTLGEYSASLFQAPKTECDVFTAIYAFMDERKVHKYDMNSKRGKRKWISDSQNLKQKCSSMVSNEDELNEFQLSLQFYQNHRIVLIFSVTNCVASQGVFTGKEWIVPHLETDSRVTDDDKTIWILQNGTSYY